MQGLYHQPQVLPTYTLFVVDLTIVKLLLTVPLELLLIGQMTIQTLDQVPVVPMLYGMPSEEMFADADSGKFALGGWSAGPRSLNPIRLSASGFSYETKAPIQGNRVLNIQNKVLGPLYQNFNTEPPKQYIQVNIQAPMLWYPYGSLTVFLKGTLFYLLRCLIISLGPGPTKFQRA